MPKANFTLPFYLFYSLLAMTQLGKDRKTRVNSKIWFEDTKTELQLSVYQGVLAILKEYVMVFQVGIGSIWSN